MRREAWILEAAYLGTDAALAGAAQDTTQATDFLMSPLGGAWRRDEIMRVSDVTAQDLEALRTQCSADYLFVLFAGHGSERRDVYGDICPHALLADGRHAPYYAFKPASVRRSLAILDHCRGLELLREDATMRGYIKLSFSDYAVASSRQAFDSAASRMEEGAVYVFSADFNQAASDRPSFTAHMMRGAAAWSDTSPTGIVWDAREAATYGAQVLRQRGAVQNPVYDGGRRLRHPPFAVAQ